jgi:hypothetical protein
MNRISVALGASAFALAVTASVAMARTVSYEVNGKRYTYESTDRAQVAAARALIAAANAADAAKAKAEAERNGNPLVRVVGSPAQKEASDADERVQKLVEERNQVAERPPAPLPQRRTRAVERKPPPTPAKAEVARRPAAASRSQTAASPNTKRAVAEAEPATDQAVKSVFLDTETGIKTTIMVDGTIQEEPFDASLLSKLNGGPAPTGGETTGSTAPRAR